ncbi:MAG: MATE family efflux transporter [Chloroflexi bacterium]|nr:MATE family efflux transporter [Chloroflexota bacterium]MBI4197947.1 MATE family efflux transporter [Chloroflexota bacterium]
MSTTASEGPSPDQGQSAAIASTVAEAPAVPQRGAGRRAISLKGRDLTQGSIPRNLWWLAWPQMVESVLNVVDQIIDLIWAGIISVSAIAGVGIAQTYRQLTMTGRMGFDTAMRAQVARAIGAKDARLANHLALQGFTLSGGFSLIIGLSGAIFAVPLMQLLGLGQDIIDSASLYLRIQFLSVIGVSFRQMGGAALQAAGDAITPMKATTLTRVTHIVLSPFLIFGWLFFPEMGIAGAALADVIAQFGGSTWNFAVLFRGSSRLHLTLRGYRPDLPILWRIIKIGFPASVTGMERSTAQLVLVALVAHFGTLALAAFALTRRAESLAQLGGGGLGQASGVLVGQNLGAGSPDRARKTVLWALGYVIALAGALTLLLIIFAPWVVRAFTRDPELIPLGVDWLRILALSVFCLGAGQVFAQSFNTAGATLIPMVVSLVSFWIIEVPLALMLTGTPIPVGLFGLTVTFPTIAHWGQFGIAWAITIAMLIRALAFVPYFLGDGWLKKAVI